MNIDKSGIANLSNILIYGAGESALSLISEFDMDIADLDLASTDGGEVVLAKNVDKFIDIYSDKPFNIVIASQFFLDIYETIICSSVGYENIYYFNFCSKTICLAKDLFREHKKENTLYAFYDLEQNPASFDACVFANAAELYRRQNGFESIHFVIIPPILKYGRLCDIKFYDNGSLTVYKERIDALVVPIFSLIQSKIGCSVLAHREEAAFFLMSKQCFPQNYTTDNPVNCHTPLDLFDLPIPIGFFQAPKRAKQFVDDYFTPYEGKKIISFTIREYLDKPSRNNNINELKKFMGSLCQKTYYPVVVRDTVNAGRQPLEEIRDFDCFPIAALDVGIRTAFYEKAYMNFFCNNGPMVLASFNRKIKYMVFKMADESSSNTSTQFIKSRYGVDEQDTQYPWASHKYQRIFWKDDTFENMSYEFNKFIEENSGEINE